MSAGIAASTALVAMSSASRSSSTLCTTSPSKTGKHHSASLRLPLPTKSGNRLADADADAMQEIFMSLVDSLIDDRSHVMPLMSMLQNRMAMQRAAPEANGAETFIRAPPTLRMHDDMDWLLLFLEKVSDMGMVDLLAIKQADDEAPFQLICYETGLHLLLRLPSCCQIKDVLWRLLHGRSVALGRRLASFKHDMGMYADRTLNWRTGVYLLTFATDRITEVQHKATKKVVNVEEWQMTNAYQLMDNWSDMGASLQRKPMPAVKLASFFSKKDKEGPWEQDHFLGQPKAFATLCEKVHAEWAEDRKKLAVGDPSGRAVVRKELETLSKSKKEVASKKAREKALETLAGKRQRRTISLVPAVVATVAAVAKAPPTKGAGKGIE
jgi:hypothetical protein